MDFSGDHHRIDRAGLKPLPGRQIPIWFGGFAPVAFRRAARIGDGFIFGSGQRQNLEALDLARRELDNAGRNDSEFGIEALLNYQSGPGRWRGEVETWREAGADYVAVRAMAMRGLGGGLSSPREHIDALGKYWASVGDLAG